MNNKPTGLLLGLALSAALLAMAPTAQAHGCSSSDDNCNQPCTGENERHNHHWVNDDGTSDWCTSGPASEAGGCDFLAPYVQSSNILNGYEVLGATIVDPLVLESSQVEETALALRVDCSNSWRFT